MKLIFGGSQEREREQVYFKGRAVLQIYGIPNLKGLSGFKRPANKTATLAQEGDQGRGFSKI